ncbi:MAG: hypothetical protein V1847_03100 [Candidatus Diapherotrites archaeon]
MDSKQREIKRVSFFEGLRGKRGTIAYFVQEGPNTCNAKCFKCYAGAGENAQKLERGIIDPADAFRDVKELVKEFRVIIRGTELLLNPAYIPLLKLTRDKTILTNGIVLGQHPERLDLLAENEVSNIVITYPFRSNPSTETNIMHLSLKRDLIGLGIRAIKAHPFPFVLQLSTIVTKNSLPFLDDICEEARRHKADVLRFIPFTAQGGINDSMALSQSEREYLVEKVTELKKKYSKNELVIHTPGVLGLFPLRAEKKQMVSRHITPDEQLICPAGLYYFAISAVKKVDEKGTYWPVTPCHFLMDLFIGKYRGGNMLELNDEEINKIFWEADRSDCYAQVRPPLVVTKS